MADQPLTTVVVTGYNYGRYLREAVMSAIGQTRPPRILIIDDASTDETPRVIDAILLRNPEIAHRRLPRNIGVARARNLAATIVNTDWIMFLDADDWLDSRYVERAETCLAASPALDVLTTDVTIVSPHRRARVVRSQVPDFWDELLARNTIVQTSVIRRTLVTRVGGYDPSLLFEDWDFWIRALQAGVRIERLPGPHVYWREHGQNRSKLWDDKAATAAVRAKHDLWGRRS